MSQRRLVICSAFATASLSGSHSCAGHSKMDRDVGDWKYVATGTCKDMKGMSTDEAKKMLMKK